MTVRGKLVINLIVTIIGIVLIGTLGLTGLYQSRDKIKDVIDRSTPRQLRAIEYTKTMEEHTGLLFAVMGEHVVEDVQAREMELTTTMRKLELLMTHMQSPRNDEILSNPNQRMAELKDLTGQVVKNAYEGIKAEQAASRSVGEVKLLLQVHRVKNLALQESLRKLHVSATANLIDSAAKTRVITERFRKIQTIKDLLQQLEPAVAGIGEVKTAHELAVLRGQTVFALNGMIESAKWSKTLTDVFQYFQVLILSSKSPFALKAEMLSGEDETAKHNFDDAVVLSANQLRQLKRVLDEHTDDTTMSFDFENSLFGGRLSSSEAMSRMTLLSTHLSATMDAIENSAVGLIGAPKVDEIERMRASMEHLFLRARNLNAQIGEALTVDGNNEEESILGEALENLDRVERIIVREGGLVSTLKGAAEARERSRKIGERLIPDGPDSERTGRY